MATLASVILEGTDASKPSPSIPGRLYFTTDTDLIYYDTGSAWTAVGPSGNLSNPMTTAGDLIVGGTSGAPGRLAAGASGYVLTSNGSGAAPSWQAGGGGNCPRVRGSGDRLQERPQTVRVPTETRIGELNRADAAQRDCSR